MDTPSTKVDTEDIVHRVSSCIERKPDEEDPGTSMNFVEKVCGLHSPNSVTPELAESPVDDDESSTDEHSSDDNVVDHFVKLASARLFPDPEQCHNLKTSTQYSEKLEHVLRNMPSRIHFNKSRKDPQHHYAQEEESGE